MDEMRELSDSQSDRQRRGGVRRHHLGAGRPVPLMEVAIFSLIPNVGPILMGAGLRRPPGYPTRPGHRHDRHHHLGLVVDDTCHFLVRLAFAAKGMSSAGIFRTIEEQADAHTSVILVGGCLSGASRLPLVRTGLWCCRWPISWVPAGGPTGRSAESLVGQRFTATQSKPLPCCLRRLVNQRSGGTSTRKRPSFPRTAAENGEAPARRERSTRSR